MAAYVARWTTAGLAARWTPTVAEGNTEAGSERSLEHADDGALVEACLAGRREAFDRLVERHRRTVYQLCYRFVGNHDDASDLTQEVFLRAYRGLRRFQRRASFSTWLYRIAINVCLDRVANHRPPHDSLDALGEAGDSRAADPVETLARREEIGRVRRAIVRLPPKQRATLILRVYRGLRHEEIARILGSSVGAAKANLFHALTNLRKLLDQDQGVQG